MVLPEKTDQKDSNFHKSDNVEQWIETALASPIECAKLVFKSVFEMNRINLEPNQRIRVLEIMTNTVEDISNSLKSRFLRRISTCGKITK